MKGFKESIKSKILSPPTGSFKDKRRRFPVSFINKEKGPFLLVPIPSEISIVNKFSSNMSNIANLLSCSISGVGGGKAVSSSEMAKIDF